MDWLVRGERKTCLVWTTWNQAVSRDRCRGRRVDAGDVLDWRRIAVRWRGIRRDDRHANDERGDDHDPCQWRRRGGHAFGRRNAHRRSHNADACGGWRHRRLADPAVDRYREQRGRLGRVAAVGVGRCLVRGGRYCRCRRLGREVASTLSAPSFGAGYRSAVAGPGSSSCIFPFLLGHISLSWLSKDTGCGAGYRHSCGG